MDLNLQPLARACFVSGQPFVEGDRVASFLMRSKSLEIVRYDILEPHVGEFSPEGTLACRWVQAYKPRTQNENADRALKLTTESLFTTLADPTTEILEENVGMVQFMALMLERKRILKPKGRSADGTMNVYEHAKTKVIYSVPVGELTPEFFVSIQEKLGVLVGTPKVAERPAEPEAAAVAPGTEQPTAS
jgi:hypothetical protein